MENMYYLSTNIRLHRGWYMDIWRIKSNKSEHFVPFLYGDCIWDPQLQYHSLQPGKEIKITTKAHVKDRCPDGKNFTQNNRKKKKDTLKPLVSASIHQTLCRSKLDSQTHRPLKLPETSVHRNLHRRIKQEKLNVRITIMESRHIEVPSRSI